MRQKKNIKTIFLLLFIITNYGCSQQKNNEKLNFKNTIELSIESTSCKINPIIKEINILLKVGKPDDKLMEMYIDCKSNIVSNKQLVNELTEVDNDINLKSGTIKYLVNGEKILDCFILPAIKYLNESEDFDRNKLMEAFNLIQTAINQTSDLSESLETFCDKYKIPREISDFDKSDYKQKIDEIKSKLGN